MGRAEKPQVTISEKSMLKWRGYGDKRSQKRYKLKQRQIGYQIGKISKSTDTWLHIKGTFAN